MHQLQHLILAIFSIKKKQLIELGGRNNLLAYDATFYDAGSPGHFVVPIRVQTNGGFFGDWHMVENGDENFLKRIGRDSDCPLPIVVSPIAEKVLYIL